MEMTIWTLIIYFVYTLILISDSISEKDFNNEALSVHNGYRGLHGVPPLKADEKLINLAKEYASNASKAKGFGEVSAGENVYQVCANYKISLTPKLVCKAW